MTELPFVEKYRPESLEDIVGDSGTEALKAFVKTGQFPLAIILYGPFGTGKTARARSLTRDYYVQNGLYLPTATFRDIRSGTRVSPEYEGIFPPVLFVDAAVTRDIEFIKNTVQTFMKRVPPKGLKKIIIFDEADRLSFDAQRALRPLIEKYPNTVTIYTTNELDKIDSAIQDRAAGATFEVKYPGSEYVAAYLKKLAAKEKVEIPDEKIREIAVESESVRQAVGKLGTEITVYRAKQAPPTPPPKPPEEVPTLPPAAPPGKISRSEFDLRFEKSLNNWNTFNVQLLSPGLAGEIHYTVPEREKELVAKFTPDYIITIGKADIDLQRETSWKTYNASYDRQAKYGEHYLDHLDDIVHTLSRNVADKAFRAIIEEVKKPTAPPPAPLGLREEHKKLLEDAFRRVFEEAGVKDIPMATFRDELERLLEDLKTVDQARAYDLAYTTIVDVAKGLLPKRPKPEVTPLPPTPTRAPARAPPAAVPPVEMLGPRRRDIITVQCWVPTCINECIVDKDLMRRVTLVPVLKGWSPMGTRYEPLLPLPPLFFYSCEIHKEEKFGYKSIYDALAYLLYESRSSTKRLTITKGTFADIGLDVDDINAVQAAEVRWIPK